MNPLRKSLKSIRDLRVSAFDPVHKSLPKYSEGSMTDCNSVRHLLAGRDVRMSGLLWELSLREEAYKPLRKSIEKGAYGIAS